VTELFKKFKECHFETHGNSHNERATFCYKITSHHVPHISLPPQPGHVHGGPKNEAAVYFDYRPIQNA